MLRKFDLFLLTLLSLPILAESGKIYTESSILWFSEKKQAENSFNRYINIPTPFQKYQATCQYFQIDPQKNNVVTGKAGVRLVIEKNSFMDSKGRKVKSSVTICLREMIDPLALAFSGIGLYYHKNGKVHLFESAGMFYISATSKQERVYLAKQRKIEVQFPRFYYTQNFSLYRMDGNRNWQANQEKVRAVQAENEEFSDGEGSIGVWIAPIGKMGMYNFDKPQPEFACLQGKVKLPNKNRGKHIIILVLGIDHKFINYSSLEQDSSFQIDALRQRYYKIVVLDEKGNVGVSETFRSSNKTGFSRLPEGNTNFKQKIQEIAMKALDKNVLEDPQKFRRYLGIYKDYYQINYPKKKK
ncbi:MAG: hypothetical protein AAF518_15985 [Spirochaetota bacterium]